MTAVQTLDSIESILRNPLDREWSIQGFGMLRTYLDPDRVHRLHIWDPLAAFEEVSTIHDHPWDFVSNVISGQIRNQRYKVSDGYDHSAEEYQHAQILCGEGGGIVGPVGKTWLREAPQEHYGAGQFYSQTAAELHESRPSPGAVTIISRTFHGDTEHANVYWDEGDWVTAEPRPATDAEVLQFARLAFERWAPRGQ